MVHSMTAFSSQQKHLDWGLICWELKSVNHRYMEANFRLPEPLRFLEIQCRSLLRNSVYRGKLDCQLKFQESPAVVSRIELNENLINGLLTAADKLATQWNLGQDVSVSTILGWPNVVLIDQLDYEKVADEVTGLFSQALRELIEFRKTEGQALCHHITEKLNLLKVELNKAKGVYRHSSEVAKDKLLTRLNYLQLTVPEGRIEQEIAILLTRMDVTEEFDRLYTHILEVEKVLAKGGVVGRQLDFLMQELNREVNTIGSKSDSAELTQSTVLMKVLVEQMREQIQNLE